jgi:hypothetical protein
MHVLRKLTGCLSSATCNNDESPQHEEYISSTTHTLSRLSSIEDITIKPTVFNKVNSTLEHQRIKQTVVMDEK